ncbi:MAG TPA: FkbM family methyltransferase [Longimicrobium sp.]
MPALRTFLIRSGLFRPARAVRRALRADARRMEDAAAAFYRALLPEGALVFDIGASVGHMSEALLRAGVRVVAVEPQPECVAELRARCGGRPGFTLLPAAVGAAPGVATLYLRPHHAASSLRRDWLGEVVGTLDVPVVTLAALVERYGAPAYCKVDVEGAEEEVFSTLPGPLPLVSFEYHRSRLDQAAACLRRVASADAEVNLTHAGPPHFSLAEWVPADDFLRRIDRELGDRAAPGWGDIWVRTRAA